MASIILDKVTVEFPIYNMSARSLKSQLLNLTTGGKLGANAKSKVVVKALDNVSLHLKHGDRVGIIGHNGAGKSTLLRTLSQVYEPTSGRVIIDGTISSLFDMTLGMDPESTGYDNIVIRGLIQGLTSKQIKAKVDDIANFSELGDYLAMPVRTYSTGMKLRLAFAIATSVSPDILVLDEIMGAGDAAFMNKARKRIDDLIQHSSIVLLASHSQEIINNICNKILRLETGKIKFLRKIVKPVNIQPIKPPSKETSSVVNLS